LYALAHNPAYRLCMTVKGYLQSTHVDYYLGEGMAQPPKPLIVVKKKDCLVLKYGYRLNIKLSYIFKDHIRSFTP